MVDNMETFRIRIPRKLKKRLKNGGKYGIWKTSKIRVIWLGGKGIYGNYSRFLSNI